jgi:carbon-monoxide dehydrogenase medium subunit
MLARHGEEATVYAGGTELLLAMKARVLRYAHLVDLKRIAALRGVELLRDGTISIGALTTHHELATHPLILEKVPAYAELSDAIANIRVRVMGTLGGNLCFAEPHADPPALLCALGARVVLVGQSGERKVPMPEFIQGEFTTGRGAGELLSRVEIPALPPRARAAYRSFGQLERPAAGVAAVRLGDDWQFWAGALTARPTLLARAPDDVAGAAARLEADDDMHGSADYKRHLVTVLARRAMQACLS